MSSGPARAPSRACATASVPWEDSEIVCAFSSVRHSERMRLTSCLSAVGRPGARRKSASLDDSACALQATHVICGEPRRTLKVLFALARGAWLVGPEWLEACEAQGEWIDAAQFELAALPGARSARLGVPQRGRLLLGVPVHVAAETNIPTEAFNKLLHELGATIVPAAADARIVIEAERTLAAAGDGGCVHSKGGWPQSRLSEAALLRAVEQFALPPEIAPFVCLQPRARPPLEELGNQPFGGLNAPPQPTCGGLVPSASRAAASGGAAARTLHHRAANSGAHAAAVSITPAEPAVPRGSFSGGELVPRPGSAAATDEKGAVLCAGVTARADNGGEARCSGTLMRAVAAAVPRGLAAGADPSSIQVGAAAAAEPAAQPATQQLSGRGGSADKAGVPDLDWLSRAAASVAACLRGPMNAPPQETPAAPAARERARAEPTRVLPRRQSAGKQRSAAKGEGLLACGVFSVGSGLQLHVIAGRGEQSSEYFIIDDILLLFRTRLRGCNVDLLSADAAPPPAPPAGSGCTHASTTAHARLPGAKRRRRVDFLGELLAGPPAATGQAGRFSLALAPDTGGAPLAALTMHVHAGCGVAEILLCAVRQQRARRGLGRAMVECALHALRASKSVPAVVCIASPDSVGFWHKLAFSRDTNLSAAAWDALCDPFDDSVVLELHPDVVASCDTRATAPAFELRSPVRKLN